MLIKFYKIRFKNKMDLEPFILGCKISNIGWRIFVKPVFTKKSWFYLYYS